jgi:hypothetical protein
MAGLCEHGAVLTGPLRDRKAFDKPRDYYFLNKHFVLLLVIGSKPSSIDRNHSRESNSCSASYEIPLNMQHSQIPPLDTIVNQMDLFYYVKTYCLKIENILL